jgi:hypothetical protein
MPISIKGREYVTVVERMNLLRESGKLYEMVDSQPITLGERVVWQVKIMIDGNLFIGSAEAHLNAKPGSADATDPFACAETSALGRALGVAGFGSIESIASADEIVRVEPRNGNGISKSHEQALHDLAAPGSYEEHHADELPTAEQMKQIAELANRLKKQVKRPVSIHQATNLIRELLKEESEVFPQLKP